jgi:hypothetical protein
LSTAVFIAPGLQFYSLEPGWRGTTHSTAPFVPVDGLEGPVWPRKLLYGIASAFRREMGFDFVQWSAVEDDGKGYVIADAEGRALGGFVVRWRA